MPMEQLNDQPRRNAVGGGAAILSREARVWRADILRLK
jgi:hypothetical protein